MFIDGRNGHQCDRLFEVVVLYFSGFESGQIAGIAMASIIATIGKEMAGVPAILEFFGNLHPVVVHFPIALVIVAAGAEIFGVFCRGHRRYSMTIVCVVVAAFFSIFAAWAGWLNAIGDARSGTAERVLLFHRWIGIAMASVITITLIVTLIDMARPRYWLLACSRATLILAALLVMVAGYLGGELVYGNGYLLSAFNQSSSAGRVAVGDEDLESRAPSDFLGGARVVAQGPSENANVVLYKDKVVPILAAHCYSCHGPKKQRGSLRLDQMSSLLSQQPPTTVIVPGDASASGMIQRVTLSHDDVDFMPASGEPLSAGQIDILRSWINNGAPIVLDSGPVLVGDKTPSVEVIKSPAVDPDVITVPLSNEQGAALNRLQEQGIRVVLISEKTTGLEVNASVGAVAFDQEMISDIGVLGEHVVWLSFGRTAITDEDLNIIPLLTNLQRLRLDGTEIGDGAMSYIAIPKNLNWLNIYDTNVSDQSIPVLASMSALRRIFVWDSSISKQGAIELATLRPDLEVVTGSSLLIETKDEASETIQEAGGRASQGLPACCEEAVAQGGECSHPCCIKARETSAICEVCKPAS